MAHQLNALPAGSTVLITGVNGYIGSHIANILLGMGFRVRGAVRAPKPWLNEMFDTRYGKGVFETFLLSAFDDVSALKKAMEDVAGVLHVVWPPTIRNMYLYLADHLAGNGRNLWRKPRSHNPLGHQGLSKYA